MFLGRNNNRVAIEITIEKVVEKDNNILVETFLSPFLSTFMTHDGFINARTHVNIKNDVTRVTPDNVTGSLRSTIFNIYLYFSLLK